MTRRSGQMSQLVDGAGGEVQKLAYPYMYIVQYALARAFILFRSYKKGHFLIAISYH